MEKETRSAIETATQKARRLLEADFQEQLDGVFDVRIDGRIAEEPGAHLDAGQRRVRRKIVAAIAHKRAGGMKPAEAVVDYLRDAAFTVLNRFVALKMLEARELVQPCVSQGEASSGFNEFCGLAPGVRTADGAGYRLYLECLFDELSTEVKVLFDRRDAPSALWPRRAAFLELLDILNAPALAGVWAEDETIGWVYQYFNGQDERRAMREASQAPRNSRELAVRNQFFTPRYVVQFLTDNTLGRIWYEMRDGDTALADSCEYMVRQPDETWAPRAKKDPRDLRVLDPACGSGHFLLYAFDLLVAIYQEAWADPASPASEITGAALRADYPDLDALKLAMPGLILAHNLHGVDIDPRCAQIAQLALWMRAQRAFREFGVARAARPLIRRSNIVIAEPMPGEQDLRDEFLRELKEDRLEGLMRRALDIPADQPVPTNRAMADSLAALVETVWGELALAGDMGVLLKIERTLARGVEKARREWEADMPLFRISEFGVAEGGLRIAGEEIVQFIPGEGLDFWGRAERLVLRALEEYADAARGAGLARRRLFAEDAAHGFALVDLVSKKFDVVLMNPPFGAPTSASQGRLGKDYRAAKADILAMFVQRGRELVGQGFLGAITNRTCLFASSLTEWRKQTLLSSNGIALLADLGHGVLDQALVEAACYVLGPSRRSAAQGFLDSADKGEALKAAALTPLDWFEIDLGVVLESSTAAVAYWAPPAVLRTVVRSETAEQSGLLARVGLQTSDDFRFLRLQWEVSPSSVGQDHWVPFAKGGEYSPYADIIHLAVNWADGAREQKAFAAGHAERTGSARGNDASRDFKWNFVPGLTYSERTTSDISIRILPRGCITGTSGPGIYSENSDNILCSLAYFSTGAYRQLLELSIGSGDAVESGSAARHYTVGSVSKSPFPSQVLSDLREVLENASERAVSATRKMIALDPTAPTPCRHQHLRMPVRSVDELSKVVSLNYFNSVSEVIEASGIMESMVLKGLGSDGKFESWLSTVCVPHPASRPDQDLVSKSVAELYCLSEDALIDRVTNRNGFSRALSKKTWYADRKIELICAYYNANYATVVRALEHSDVRPYGRAQASWDLIEYALGRVLGDVSKPESIPADAFSSDWAIVARSAAPMPSVIAVDDQGAPHDVIKLVSQELDALGWDAPSILRELSLELGETDARRIVAKTLFPVHIGRFSKSRRKAPIYWQLATPSASYSVWLYIHAFGKDTMFRVQNDYVAPKLAHERRELEGLLADAGPSPTTAQSRAIEAQTTFVEELSALLDEVKRVAPLWDPDLDDGVILNFAPLWRLVPQNRAWQKELRAAWASLVDGDYDWAHLSMRLWPERVVPKCVKDRSLAIAHDLEDVFWFEDAAGKWQPRPTPTRPVDDLIAERTSPAVKAALQSLLEAPDPVAASGRGRRKKS